MEKRVELFYYSMQGKNLEIFVCFDAAYSNNNDNIFQIGVLSSMLRDGSSKQCAVLHHLSKKSRRVFCSELAAELTAMYKGYDLGYVC